MKAISKILVGAGLLSVGAFALLTTGGWSQEWKKGDSAPAFSAKTSDGKTHTLKSLTGQKPLVLYFIGSTCPVNAQAVKYYNRVAAAYKGKVNFVGVIDADAAGFKSWQEKFKAPFPVLLDPDMKIIKAYKAERSPWTIMVDKTGKIQKEWAGYSVGEINELSASIAGATKGATAKIDTSGAPTSPRAG
ncbi:MAG TPA: peroxiredoxin family protein [Fimbriimonadaceae bacterium]|nr:peroxiredoxin family protein [Fimbriimonadaceae bacterium]